jgi:oxygen-independent coproporphyrinogen III oxidase
MTAAALIMAGADSRQPAPAVETPPVSSLYVHVPFCARKCDYCAFYSERANAKTIERYLDALGRELEMFAPRLKPQTIFFGGGTPSLLGAAHWERILTRFDQFGWTRAAEWTIESNPATVTLDKARLWRERGVNRVSLGIQSLSVELLEYLGRVHSRAQAFHAFDLLREAGFANINVDLMFAIPGQTMAMWRETLAEATAFGSEHLSSYEVIYEEDTPLYERLKAGQFAVNDDLACEMYDALLEAAARAGYRQYEISNFARHTSGDATEYPSLACRHNVNYWRGGAFYGAGPGATTYVDGVREANLANTVKYCDSLETGRRALEYREQLSPLARAGELAAFGLRMNSGWPYARFRELTGYEMRVEWAEEIKILEAKGYGVSEPDRFRLTLPGLRFADWAAELFLRVE